MAEVEREPETVVLDLKGEIGGSEIWRSAVPNSQRGKTPELPCTLAARHMLKTVTT